MNQELLFQYIAETKLLQVLTQAKRTLTFVGDRSTIARLKTELASINPENSTNMHSYYVWDVDSQFFEMEFDKFENNSILVISSLYNEHQIYEQINRYIARYSLSSRNIRAVKLFSDILVNLLSRQLPFKSSELEFELPEKNYAIVTTPRSGSTFLCDLLQKTGLAGYPGEHLRRPVEVLARHCKFDYIRYMKIMMTRRSTKNRVFGTKLISHFIIHYRKEGLDFDSFFTNYFSKVIYLQRGDKIGQAISLYLAKKTNIWHIFNDEMREKYNQRVSNIDIEKCNIEEVKSFYDFLLKQERFIESFLKENKINPLRISYEDLVASTNINLNDIMKYLEIDLNGYKLPESQTTSLKKTKSLLTSQITQKLNESYPNLCLSSHEL